MGEIKFVGALLLTAIFGVAMTLFAIGFASDNSASFSLADQPGYNDTANNVQGKLSDFTINITNASDSFYKSEILEGENVRTGGHFKLGPTTALETVDSTARQGFSAVFGSDNAFSFVLTALLSFLALVLALLIWKTWGGRNPE